MRCYDYHPGEGPQSFRDALGRPVLCKGGGGGSQAFYKNMDKLYGEQARAAEFMLDQSMPYLPGNSSRSNQMVEEAFDGTLGNTLKNEALANANASIGTSNNDALRNLASFGAIGDPSGGRAADIVNKNAFNSAALRAGAANTATQYAEEQKWNLNAGQYAQLTGMGNGAIQGLSSAASGLGGLASQANQNAMANASGYGQFGGALASGLVSKADGGYIQAPKLAGGGNVWEAYKKNNPIKTSGAADGGGTNPIASIAAGMAPTLAAEGLKQAGVGDMFRSGVSALKNMFAPAGEGLGAGISAPGAGAGGMSPAGGLGNGISAGANSGVASGMGSQAGSAGLGNGISAGANSGVASGVGSQAGSAGSLGNGISAGANSGVASGVGSQAGSAGSLGSGISAGANSGVASGVGSQAGSAAATVADSMASTGAGIADTVASGTGLADMATVGTGLADTAAVGTGIADAAAVGTGIADAAAVGTGIADAAAGITAATEVAGAASAAAAGAAGTVAATNFWNPVGWAAALYGLSEMFHDGGNVGGRKDFRPGGRVTGPGTETSDSIPAWLSKNEYVLNAEAVKMIGKQKLDKLNNKGLEVRRAKQADAPIPVFDPANYGLELAAGGFLGVALGAGVDEYDRQQELALKQAEIVQKQETSAREKAGAGQISSAGQDCYGRSGGSGLSGGSLEQLLPERYRNEQARFRGSSSFSR